MRARLRIQPARGGISLSDFQKYLGRTPPGRRIQQGRQKALANPLAARFGQHGQGQHLGFHALGLAQGKTSRRPIHLRQQAEMPWQAQHQGNGLGIPGLVGRKALGMDCRQQRRGFRPDWVGGDAHRFSAARW